VDVDRADRPCTVVRSPAFGITIPTHQIYLTSIAEQLNERPRAALGFLTPREAFE
jgi:hypothetical protein